MAHIKRREWTNAQGKTEVRWDVKWYDEAGKPKQETKDSEREAKRRKREVEEQKDKGTYVDAKAGKVTVRSFGLAWLESKGFPPSTYERVERRLRLHVFPKLGDIAVNRVKPMTAMSWIASLEGAETSKEVIFVHVQEMFDAAVEDRLITTNPFRSKSVDRPKAVHSELVPWEPENVQAVHDGLSARFQVLVPIGARIGLRQGEAFGLGQPDVDFLRGIVRVERQVKVVDRQLVFAPPKGGRTRTVKLFPGARDALAVHLAAHPATEVTLPWEKPGGKLVTVPLIVTTSRGNAVHYRDFNRRIWHKALGAAGLEPGKKNGMHALRHYCASAWLANGVSPKQIAAWLGHRDAAFTLRVYGHLMRARDEAAMVRDLEAFHGSRGISAGSDGVAAPGNGG
jgi:integrase